MIIVLNHAAIFLLNLINLVFIRFISPGGKKLLVNITDSGVNSLTLPLFIPRILVSGLPPPKSLSKSEANRSKR